MKLYWIEVGTTRLAIVGRPRGHDWLEDDIRSLKEAGVEVLVSALTASESEELGLTDEENACRSSGIDFVSFPIEDRSIPTSLYEFGKLLGHLHALRASGKRLAAHCRAGIGRSAVIAASLLVKNGLSVEAAFGAIEKARGTSVPDTLAQRSWVENYSKDRTGI